MKNSVLLQGDLGTILVEREIWINVWYTATITIPYDDDLLPMGFRPKDIKTYYYDEDLAQWKELERVSVDTAIICI